MIEPNLMVADIKRSVEFYTDVIGMRLAMSVDASQHFEMDKLVPGAVFASLKWGEQELMLQTVESLSAELSILEGVQRPAPWGTVYFRGLSPDEVEARASEADILERPSLTWYGMRELYVRDPDGHILCIGEPTGSPP